MLDWILLTVPPAPAMFAQLLVGLINGAFYAMLSLGLAVIFGLLNIINFTHGAQCRGLRPISKPPGRGSFERAIAGSSRTWHSRRNDRFLARPSRAAAPSREGVEASARSAS